MEGILVIGHGSRSKDAYDTFFKIVEGLKNKMKDDYVEGCFMELSEPNIPPTIQKMYDNGVRKVTVLPYFLFTGIHIKEDIPEILREIKERYNDLEILMANPIEYDEKLIDILVERVGGEVKCI